MKTQEEAAGEKTERRARKIAFSHSPFTLHQEAEAITLTLEMVLRNPRSPEGHGVGGTPSASACATPTEMGIPSPTPTAARAQGPCANGQTTVGVVQDIAICNIFSCGRLKRVRKKLKEENEKEQERKRWRGKTKTDHTDVFRGGGGGF